MQTKIQKWGNSLGVRIPRAFAIEARIRPGSAVDISIDKGVLRIRPVVRRYALKDLLVKIRSDNRHSEVSTGRRSGREVW